MEIFGTDRHKIIHGDALEALKSLPDNSVDLLFADPPYTSGLTCAFKSLSRQVVFM